MRFEVRPAHGAVEREALLRGRYAVYVEEMGAMPPSPDRRITDAFDDLPDTLHLVAAAPEGHIVAGSRFVADGGAGTTADSLFDFGRWLPPGARRGAGSMLWALPEARGAPGLVRGLMDLGLQWSIDQGVTHILATVNPPVAERFARVGYRPVGDVFVHGPHRLPIQPMILETGVPAYARAA
jgi:N-acyl-L-homoserine lactone synthetase